MVRGVGNNILAKLSQSLPLKVHLTQMAELLLDGGARGSWKGQLWMPLGSKYKPVVVKSGTWSSRPIKMT